MSPKRRRRRHTYTHAHTHTYAHRIGTRSIRIATYLVTNRTDVVLLAGMSQEVPLQLGAILELLATALVGAHILTCAMDLHVLLERRTIEANLPTALELTLELAGS